MTDLIQRGKHRAHVRSIQFGLAGTDDKEQIVVGFELTNTEDVDHGRSITAFLFLTDKTFDRTIESLRHCGWTGDELAELPDLAASGALAEEVELVVDHEEYNNEWQAKVKWINKPGGGAVQLKKPLEGDALKRFSASMKGRVRASSPPARTASAPKPTNGGGHPNAPGNGGGIDDDIPFATCDLAHEPGPIARVLR